LTLEEAYRVLKGEKESVERERDEVINRLKREIEEVNHRLNNMTGERNNLRAHLAHRDMLDGRVGREAAMQQQLPAPADGPLEAIIPAQPKADVEEKNAPTSDSPSAPQPDAPEEAQYEAVAHAAVYHNQPPPKSNRIELLDLVIARGWRSREMQRQRAEALRGPIINSSETESVDEPPSSASHQPSPPQPRHVAAELDGSQEDEVADDLEASDTDRTAADESQSSNARSKRFGRSCQS
jgi:hypothetical protein